MADSLAGRLLVASPRLYDPNFFRTVVWIVEHGDDGAVGLVLNRDTEEPLAHHLPGWEPWSSEPRSVFVGGPVANEVAVGVAEDPRPEPERFSAVLGRIGLLDLSLDPTTLDGVGRLRVFSGYAGWSPGQLEAELEEGGWFVVETDPDDVFTTAPERLWASVLGRQPGRLSLYAFYPTDPRLN